MMWNRLYTIISKVLAAVAFVALMALPVWFAETKLVRPYSGVGEQLVQAEYSLQQMAGKPYLLVGDSTVRDLHRTEEEISEDKEITNLALGGSVAAEWYFMLRNALKENKDVKVIALGMSTAYNIKLSSHRTAYLPFLVNFRDVYAIYKAGKMDFTHALDLAIFTVFKMSSLRDDFLFTSALKLGWPRLADALMAMRVEINVRDHEGPVSKNQTTDPFFDFEKILDLARSRNIKLVLVRSPAGSELRNTVFYKEAGELFANTCAKYQLTCADFSTLLEDERFGKDHTHLRQGNFFLYREALRRKLHEL